MSNNNESTNSDNLGEIHAEWQIPEFDQHERNRTWYIIAVIIAILMMLYAFFTANFLFAIIIIITALIVILRDGRDSTSIRVKISEHGIILGRKFYEYDEIKDFSIIHKPQYEVKNLYLNFNNILQHRLTIPLREVNPLEIREILLQYLSEDLERTDPPLSESISKIFKI
ncbi:MAG: hypothetical protein U9Q85_03250 [Patescibacteria group bacterium]|nr:hypothetical protein [Patescibacteria group bacterium]